MVFYCFFTNYCEDEECFFEIEYSSETENYNEIILRIANNVIDIGINIDEFFVLLFVWFVLIGIVIVLVYLHWLFFIFIQFTVNTHNNYNTI